MISRKQKRGRQKDRKTERHRDRKTERQQDRKTERQKNRMTQRQGDDEAKQMQRFKKTLYNVIIIKLIQKKVPNN